MDREQVRDYIETALKTVRRDGMENLVRYLNESDFFTAPASAKYHLACEGGLALHTLHVLKVAERLNAEYEYVTSGDSVKIAAICHDFCKINFYVPSHDEPTEPQKRYLTSLLAKHRLQPPAMVDKGYASTLIDFLTKRYKPGMELPPYSPSYEIADGNPLGHGEKSLFIACAFIRLTTAEAQAIRWHMGYSDLNTQSPFQSIPYHQAINDNPLVSMLQIADMEASFMIERKK
ncbi:HD domain-containing protein [Candidatus Micrarchaeota archaeon]|nr:HD domain-containing protein [Candidatus Micrarchaeota archaeon]